MHFWHLFSEPRLLCVSVVGPGGPCREVSISYDYCTAVYTVTYRPAELGDHTLVVKWGERPVDGSPFRVYVVD